jgi:hypothetical protein
MANNQFIGRRVSYGVGIESVAGTEVAPTDWIRHLSADFQRKTTTIQNESALGRVEKVSDSAVVEEWSEGKLDGKVADITIGYLLYNIFGTKVTTTNADASGTVKDHTFDVGQSQVSPTLTITRKDPLTSRRHGLATLDSLEITGAQKDWVKFNASAKAKAGVTSSDTPAYLTTENEFTNKHAVVKLASSVAGLSGATALNVKSFKLSIKRSADAFYPLGSIDPSAFNTGAWEASGELTLMYDATTLESTWFANTQQALSLSIVNSDVTIGTAAHPSLTFTAPRVRLNTFSMSDDLDKIVEMTVGFYCEFSMADAYALRGVLTNTKTSY